MAVIATGVSVLLGTIQAMLAGGLMMRERIVQSSIVIGSASVTTLLATCLFVIVLEGGGGKGGPVAGTSRPSMQRRCASCEVWQT